MRGRAASNAPDGGWSRADTRSPAPTRVLRKRDPKGRSGAPRRANDTIHDWDDSGNEQTNARQGKKQLQFTSLRPVAAVRWLAPSIT